MIKVIIVDDEKNVREAAEKIVEQYCAPAVVQTTCHSIASAVIAIKEHQPDVVLLDVELGMENGFDLFKHFPSPNFKVIFITAHHEYAVKAFRFSAIDYLLKPIEIEALKQAIDKVGELIDKNKMGLKIDSFIHNMNHLSKDAKKIVLKTADSVHVVNLNDIMYCEADRSYTSFYLNDKSRIMVSHTLGEYEELFNDYGFLRVHQSYLLNLDYLKRFEKADGGKAVLRDNTAIPVATRKKDQLMERLSNL
jgi:two-component system, LytTR family, response regulator